MRLRDVLRARPDRRARTRRHDDPRRAGLEERFALDYWQARHDHPICHYHETTGDWRAYRLSDFVEMRRFRCRAGSTPSGSDPSDVQSLITVGLDAPLSHTKVFLLARSGDRDFDVSDCLLLDVLRPYFAMRYEAARSRRHGLDESGLCSALTRRERQVLHLSPRARPTQRSPSTSGSRVGPCAATSRTPTPSSASTRERPLSGPSPTTRSRDPRASDAAFSGRADLLICYGHAQIFGISTLKEGAPTRSWPRPSASTSGRRTRVWPSSRAASPPSSRTRRAVGRRRPSSRSRRTGSGSSGRLRGASRSRTPRTRSSRSSGSWAGSGTRSPRR